MRRKLLGLLALLLGAAGAARAQTVELGGFAEVDHFSYIEAGTAGQLGRGNRGLLQLRGTARLHDRVELFAAGELRGSWAARGEGRGYLNEGYADLLFPGVDLRVGKQTIVWGRTDVVNPTDQLAPREFSDPLETDDERLGVLAARLRGSIGRARVEGVVAPSVVLSRLPGSGSRWAPALPPTMRHPADPARTLEVSYAAVQAEAPAAQLKNAQYAARVSTTHRGWDLSLSYFDGWDDLPATVQRDVAMDEDEVRVELRQEYSRRRAVGGDLATTLGPYSLRAEGAHLMPDSLGGPDYFQYVVGLERFFGDPLGAGSTLLLVQWIQEITPRDFQPGPFDLNHVFRRSLMARAQHNLTPSLRLAADGVYDFRTEGYYLQPGASLSLWDRLLMEGSIDLLGGGNEAFFGAFAGNNRLRTSLRYSF